MQQHRHHHRRALLAFASATPQALDITSPPARRDAHRVLLQGEKVPLAGLEQAAVAGRQSAARRGPIPALVLRAFRLAAHVGCGDAARAPRAAACSRLCWAHPGPRRCLLCVVPLLVMTGCELNAFFLKRVLWVPPRNALNTGRLCIWVGACGPPPPRIAASRAPEPRTLPRPVDAGGEGVLRVRVVRRDACQAGRVCLALPRVPGA